MQPISIGPARSSLSSAAPSFTPFANNKNQVLDHREMERLHNLLTSFCRIGSFETTFSIFLFQFLEEIKSRANNPHLISNLCLKGGAVNYALIGERIDYADIDVEIDVPLHLSLIELKKTLLQWQDYHQIKFDTLKLVPDQFIIVTLPSYPKKIDIQFTQHSVHKCTCSYNSLRIGLLTLLYSNPSELSENARKCMVYTVNNFPVSLALTDLHESRSQAPQANLIFEGFRAHCALITKGIIPRSLKDEVGFINYFVNQYGPNNYQFLEKKSSHLSLKTFCK